MMRADSLAMACQEPLLIEGITLSTRVEYWPLAAPFRISGQTYTGKDFLVVTLEKDGVVGRGEAAGVRYLGDTPNRMQAEVEALAPAIVSGLSRDALQALLPPGGARNALDCALWDLEAKLTGVPVWTLAGLESPRPIVTMFTCGIDAPMVMAETALSFEGAREIKLKLQGDEEDAARVRAVRKACPEVWLGIDANQGFDRAAFERLLPVLVGEGVSLVEQPFPRGEEGLVDGVRSTLPIAADESFQSLADLAALEGRFQAVNIKLDKCGGLTEGIAIAHAARAMGLAAMVGNMMGTSLGMAPAWLLGQIVDHADLDGAIFLAADREPATRYANGMVDVPLAAWGCDERA